MNMNESSVPMVGILMGSVSDKDVMKGAVAVLKEMAIPFEVKVISAHRTPELAREYAVSAADRGINVIIAGAGWAAHLAGVLASHTTLPVIGVPIDSSPLQGMDALLATVQMPPGIPVATVSIGVGGARNAAVLAAEIIALKDKSVADKIKKFRQTVTSKALASVDELADLS